MHPRDLELGLQVQGVLDRAVRPLLNIDAGEAEITSVEGGHVHITLLGACGRCMFKASCGNYTVMDVLEKQFGDSGATFSVEGVRRVAEARAVAETSAVEGARA